MAADPMPCRVCGSPLPARPWGVSGPLGHWWVCGEDCANEAKERQSSSDEVPERPWHVIHGEDLLSLLKRCSAGEDPEMVYVESYANSEHVQ